MLEQTFEVKLSTSEEKLHVKLLEDRLWEALYKDPSLYSLVGREGCLALDFAFNIGGSEAIAETFFRVMEAQRKDNQSPETMDMRTLISFCMPHPIQCPEAISKIAAIFREGDLRNKVKRHRTNIFYDKRGRAAAKYKVSKALDNFALKKSGCAYIK